MMKKMWIVWLVLVVCLVWVSGALALSGSGTEADPYLIGNVTDYQTFVQEVNNGKTTLCAKLTGNIDFSGKTMSDYVIEAYAGALDGNGMTLSNMKIQNIDGFALFKKLAANGVLKNISLSADGKIRVISVSSTVLLCHTNEGRIENCNASSIVFESPFSDKYGTGVSVFAYENKGIITGCTAGVSGLRAQKYAAGIACINETTGLIENCTVNGEIKAYSETGEVVPYAGGIAAVNKGQIKNCVNEATVMAEKEGVAYAGGIAAIASGTKTSPAVFYRCSNQGTIKTIDEEYNGQNKAAGIVAACENDCKIEKCFNTGTITGANYAGGIAGTRAEGTYINNCWNSGTVSIYETSTGEHSVAGIVCSGDSGKVENCLNVGSVIAKSNGVPVSAGSATNEINCYALENCVVDFSNKVINVTCTTKFQTQTEMENGTVLGLLNAGNQATVWKQGSSHPVLVEESEIVTPTYTVTVNNGTGGGTYKAGETVTVTATVLQNHKFVNWTGTDGLTFTNGSAEISPAAFAMPAQDVTITANFEEIVILESIAVTTEPKTTYIAGEDFDAAGMVVTATYSDNTTQAVTGYTVANGTSLALNQTSVTISYTEGGVTASTELAITVEAPSYTVTINNGTGGGTYKAGETVTITATVPENQKFSKWTGVDGFSFAEGSAETSPATFTMPSKDVTITATFEDIVPVELIIQEGPTKTEYFAGKNFDSNGMVLVVRYNDETTRNINQAFIVKDGNYLEADQESVTISYSEKNVEVTVQQPITVKIPTYAVTVNNGTGSKNYAEGEAVTITADAAPEGMFFTGWICEGDSTLPDTSAASITFTMPAKPLTITATYAKIELTSIAITHQPKTAYTEDDVFNPTGMIVRAYYNNQSSQAVSEYDISLTNPLTTKDTAIIVSYSEGGITKTTTLPITVAVRTYAVTVTNGSGSGSYAEGVAVTVTAAEAPKGQYFTGWTGTDELGITDATAPSLTFTMPAKPVMLTANYAEIKLASIVITRQPLQTSYTAGKSFCTDGMEVTVHYNDGTSRVITSYQVENGNNLKPDQTSVVISFAYNGVTVRTEQPVAVNRRTYTLAFAPGAYGTGEAATASKTDGINYTLPDALFTRRGFAQTGWALADGGEKAYELNGTYAVDAVQTFYPVWTHEKYAIEYVLDGGSIMDAACPASYTYGTGAVLPAKVVRDGFRFLGWYADGTGPVTSIGTDETGARTFTAHWMQLHSILFDANGAQGSMQPVAMDNGTLFTLPQNGFVIPEGQRFCGWLIGESLYQPGDSFTLLAPVTVKALWEYLPAEAPPAAHEGKMDMDEQEILDAVLTDEERSSGKEADVFLVAEDITAHVPEEDQKIIARMIEDAMPGMYLDITLFKQLKGEKPVEVPNPGGKIRLSFRLPAHMISHDPGVQRSYFVIYAHNGVPGRISAEYDAKTNVLSFYADAFSTYLVAYEDTRMDAVPQTGDASNVALWLALACLSLAGAAWLIDLRVRKG